MNDYRKKLSQSPVAFEALVGLSPDAFAALVEVPPGAGYVVAMEWDFDGSGDYAVAEPGFEGDGGSLRQVAVTR